MKLITAILLYRIILFGVVIYLVQWHGWSAWWFLAALLITPIMDGKE